MKTLAETFKLYFQFRGRADRREFWIWVLAMLAVSVPVVCVLAVIAFLFGNTAGHPVAEGVFHATIVLLGLFWLVMFLPSLTVTIRRLRDAGINPWLLIIPAALGIGTFLALFDRALSNMDGSAPDFTDAFVYPLVGMTALTGMIFLILLCKPSKNNETLKPKHGCLTTLSLFAGLVIVWTIIDRTQNLGYASADNVKRYTNIEIPAYKVKWTKKYSGFDGFEHQISLKFKNVPDESFYSMLDSRCEEFKNNYSSDGLYWPWYYENEVYYFTINHSPHNKFTSDYLRSIGYSQEFLDKHDISIRIKIPKNQKEWSLSYIESI